MSGSELTPEKGGGKPLQLDLQLPVDSLKEENATLIKALLNETATPDQLEKVEEISRKCKKQQAIEKQQQADVLFDYRNKELDIYGTKTLVRYKDLVIDSESQKGSFVIPDYKKSPGIISFKYDLQWISDISSGDDSEGYNKITIKPDGLIFTFNGDELELSNDLYSLYTDLSIALLIENGIQK